MEDQLQVIDQVTTTAIDMAFKFGPKLFVACVILAAGVAVGGWVARALDKALVRLHLEPPVRLLLQRLAKLFVLGLFAIMALQNLGVELLPLIAGLGVAGAGVALAMQGVLSNVVAGLTIIFSRPFRVGEYISIVNVQGEVLEITLFNTTLGHADLSKVVVPNRKIVGEILHNYGKIRQVSVEVGIAYGNDVPAALEAVREAIAEVPQVLRDPAPLYGVARLADGAIVLHASPWVAAADFGGTGGVLNQAILRALKARGIALPLREVRMLSSDAYVASGRAA